MADTKTSALAAIPALDGADVLPIVDATDTVSKKVSITQLDGRYIQESEVDADIKTLALPASTTISAFGATVVDDADAAAVITTLGLAGKFAPLTAIATVADTTDTLAAGDDHTVIQYTAAGAVTVTLANIATGFEAVLVSLGAGGLSVAAGGMTYANSFTPKLTVAQGEAIYVRQTAASTWAVIGGTAT